MIPFRFTRLLILALCALGLALASGERASAAIPCGRQVLNDWADGRIDKSYPAHCYREALELANTDVRAYSSLEADIERALQNAIGGVVPGGQIGNPSGAKFELAVREQQLEDTLAQRRDMHHSDDDVLTYDVGPSTPGGGSGGVGDTGLPIPLIILAALAFALLLAGSVGMVARRAQESRG